MSERAGAGLCDGRVVIVTGAGRGLGRAHALAFAAEGARVVVNDVGAALDGTGSDAGPAQEVVDEIRAAGGEAVASTDDVADWEGAGRLVATAVDTFGGLDTLVCNAGIVRDRMLVNMSVDEWDDVMRVHLRGTFCPVRHAVDLWRAEHKAGRGRAARIVTTSSGAGLFGSVSQANYSAAKAGIASFTIVAAAELARYGVLANTIAPSARSRMTEEAFAEMMAAPAEGFDRMAPENVSPLVVWLGSDDCTVTGRAFEVQASEVTVCQGWTRGPTVDQGSRWTPTRVGAAADDLVASAAQQVPVYGTAT
jgi:NAD(P)-dependent dehydrogenase (short-subunit alcohol dehydrogenase family)